MQPVIFFFLLSYCVNGVSNLLWLQENVSKVRCQASLFLLYFDQCLSETFEMTLKLAWQLDFAWETMEWQRTPYIWVLPEMKPKRVSELNLSSLCLTCRKLSVAVSVLCRRHPCNIRCGPINAPLYILISAFRAIRDFALFQSSLLVPVVFVCQCCPHVLCTVNKLQSGCCSVANEAGDNSCTDDVLQLLCCRWDNDYTHFFDVHSFFFDPRLILYWRHREKETKKSNTRKNTRIPVPTLYVYLVSFYPSAGSQGFIHNPINVNKYCIPALLFLAIHATVLPSVFNNLVAFGLSTQVK